MFGLFEKWQILKSKIEIMKKSFQSYISFLYIGIDRLKSKE
jgi:hypothetical protein